MEAKPNKKAPGMKFRNQLSLIFVVGILVMAVTTSIAVSNISSQIVRDREIQQGLQVTDSLAKQSELALLYHSKESAKDIVDTALNFPGVKAVAIVTETGTVLHIGGEVVTQVPFYKPSVAKMVHEDNDYWSFSSPVVAGASQDSVWGELYGEDEEKEVSLGYITVLMGKDTVILMERSILRGNLLISLLVAVVLLLLLLGISRRLTKPLEKLAATMKQAEEGDSIIRADVGGPVDITDMQHAFNSMMEALENRQKELMHAMSAALESARVKGEFAANVTHELRTPMNAVLGMLDLLMTMGLSSKQLEYVETAKTSGESLLQLIDEILNFSQVDSNNLSIVKEDCYIQELLDDVINLLANQALKKNLDFGYVISPDVPRMIHSDSSRLRQVLINLVGNAIKFADVGEVSIHMDVLDVETPSSENELLVRFEVRDTGIGITTEDQQRIFDAFTQADSSSTKEYEGTGLGLAISKQIVELMGGDISVSSQPGMGSSFWFTVPTPRLDVGKPDEAPVPAFSGLNALLVDDSEIVREFGAQQLEQKGIDCTTLDTGIKALDVIRDMSANGSSLDILIVDEDMPGLKGMDFLKLTREEPSLKNTTILMLSNPWTMGDIHNDYSMTRLNKPLRPKEINTCLEKQLLGQGETEKSEPRRKTIEKLYSRPKRILVVDDNRANQQVAIGMLERMGCRCELASTGKEAVEAIIRNRFDAVLMDCYMPVMNGYDATRQIRMYEGGENADNCVPIIAMTANNTQVEMDRCKDVGMDDFLSKPLRIDELANTLVKWVPRDLPETSDSQLGEFSPDESAIVDSSASYDPLVLQELKDGIGEVIVSMIEAFLEDTPVYLRSLKEAIAQTDTKQVRELAHTIKGSALNYGAYQVVELSRLLEDKGAAAELTGSEKLYKNLVEAYTKLGRDLEEYILAADDSIQGREKGHYLLIVDDDRSMRLALKNVFKSEDYVIEEASNGMHAISICQRRMPDLVLMDAMMPEVDGFMACERIRELPNGADTPVLMITALDNEESIVKAFAAGATDFIPKPIHFAVLKQRVSRLIQANKVEKHVKQLAYHDQLTGLPNRTNLMQQLRVMVNRAQLEGKKIAILFLDLDRFKLINDTLGHDAGDLLLKAVSDRIRRCVRNQDFIARLGGDEFTVVLEGVTDQEIVSKIAAKICDALSQPFVFLQQEMFVTTSIGVSMFPDDGADIGTLIKHADSAMFRAKEQRNGYCFYVQGMEDEIARRMELDRELRSAIGANELVLYYQPQIDLATGEVIGAEALIRWNHPRHGLVMPDTFIPLAEESGLINQVSDWVLEDACRQLQAWSNSGNELFKVAVNMSTKDIQAEGFNDKLRKMLEQYDVNPNRLELEITESTLMENPEEIEGELNAMREMGLTLAIDDFGSGFSSLNYLKRLPVDVLKIDRMFIRDLEEDESDRAIVTGIIALATSMGLGTVAEGVETEYQYRLLQELGCDTCQGYYFSKPIPVADFEEKFFKQKVIV
ncbi:MAG TPA: EAL domain-containing protein [Porticoccus sp.]|nr:EAL domain-containing protein [Porticoccus sp.]